MPATDSWRSRVPQSGATTQLVIALQDNEPFEVDISFYRVSRDERVLTADDGSDHRIPLTTIVDVDARPLKRVEVD